MLHFLFPIQEHQCSLQSSKGEWVEGWTLRWSTESLGLLKVWSYYMTGSILIWSKFYNKIILSVFIPHLGVWSHLWCEWVITKLSLKRLHSFMSLHEIHATLKNPTLSSIFNCGRWVTRKRNKLVIYSQIYKRVIYIIISPHS